MRLAHLHLSKRISYAHSLRLQEILLEQHFQYNALNLRSRKRQAQPPETEPHQPRPTLLTFQTEPVYTVGRRHLKANPLSKAQIDFLTTNNPSLDENPPHDRRQLATFYASPRGGLLTYHAPGQLTAYLIINLRTHAITPRCFVRLLENTVIHTCARYGVPNTLITEDPGVWIGEPVNGEQPSSIGNKQSCGDNKAWKATTRKICAIGVHVTQGITSHGIGLNVIDTPISLDEASTLYRLPAQKNEETTLAPGYLTWGFNRIIACGLEGKSVTWLASEGARRDVDPSQVAHTLAEEICKSLTAQGKLKMAGVDQLVEEDILPSEIVHHPSPH